jgi:putative hydrolase
VTDNIFDRLMELLQSPGPVNWRLAAEVTDSLAGNAEPIEPDLLDEYSELARVAHMQLDPIAPFAIPADPAVAIVDRRAWADANLRSFSYLAEPLADKLSDAPAAGPMEEVLKPLGPVVLGMQVGAMVGFMSHRVLGQFDIGLPAIGPEGVFFVVPNIEDFARDHEIDPRQARLWVALHEVAYQGAFAVPWMKDYFVSLMEKYFEGVEFDPSAIASRFEGLENPEDLERLMADPGTTAIVSGPDQSEALGRLQAFMAFVEGHADYLMDRVAPELMPEAPRLREAINRRRAEPTQGEQLIARLAGIELTRLEYRHGASFCEAVVERWGDDGLRRLWEDPAHLPSMNEMEDPIGWAARILVDEIGSEN